MISPEFTDSESFVSTLKILADLMPGMNEPARRRAAWQVAKSKMSLKAAVAEEGFSLDGTGAPLAKAVAPALPLTASQIAQLATLKADIRALGAPPAPPRAQAAAQPATPAAAEKKPMTADDVAHLKLAADLVERGGGSPDVVADFKRRAAAAAAETVENVNLAAREAMARDPKLTYYKAVSGRTK